MFLTYLESVNFLCFRLSIISQLNDCYLTEEGDSYGKTPWKSLDVFVIILNWSFLSSFEKREVVWYFTEFYSFGFWWLGDFKKLKVSDRDQWNPTKNLKLKIDNKKIGCTKVTKILCSRRSRPLAWPRMLLEDTSEVRNHVWGHCKVSRRSERGHQSGNYSIDFAMILSLKKCLTCRHLKSFYQNQNMYYVLSLNTGQFLHKSTISNPILIWHAYAHSTYVHAFFVWT